MTKTVRPELSAEVLGCLNPKPVCTCTRGPCPAQVKIAKLCILAETYVPDTGVRTKGVALRDLHWSVKLFAQRSETDVSHACITERAVSQAVAELGYELIRPGSTPRVRLEFLNAGG
jgi:hypothetical protein